jgi:hypothetical protein
MDYLPSWYRSSASLFKYNLGTFLGFHVVCLESVLRSEWQVDVLESSGSSLRLIVASTTSGGGEGYLDPGCTCRTWLVKGKFCSRQHVCGH